MHRYVKPPDVAPVVLGFNYEGTANEGKELDCALCRL